MTAPDALRQHLADAIRAAACNGDCDSTETVCATKRVQPIVWHYGALALVEGTPEQLADAVLPLVAARDAAAYRAAADDLFAWATDGLLNAPEYGSHENVLDAAARLRDRADAVLPPVATEVHEEVMRLLADLTDPDPCRYDHHGYCQAHSWFATDPTCPHARAKAFTARADEMEQQ